MIYLALGDSITFGYESTGKETRFPAILQKRLNELERTSLYVHAKPGWTVGQLLNSLPKIPTCILQEAGLITLFIGGNDLLRFMPRFLDDENKALQRVRKSFLPPFTELVDKILSQSRGRLFICTIYNPFPKSDLVHSALAGFNGMLREVAGEKKCEIVPVDQEYVGYEERLVHRYKRGELGDFRFVKNPIHPNDAGHERIADAIFQVYCGLAEHATKELTAGKQPFQKRRKRVSSKQREHPGKRGKTSGRHSRQGRRSGV